MQFKVTSTGSLSFGEIRCILIILNADFLRYGSVVAGARCMEIEYRSNSSLKTWSSEDRCQLVIWLVGLPIVAF